MKYENMHKTFIVGVLTFASNYTEQNHYKVQRSKKMP